MISNGKKFELQSCRSLRKLQFSYKVYLHPCSNKKYKFLKIDWTPTAVAMTVAGATVPRRYVTPSHGGRSLPLSPTALDVYVVLQIFLRTIYFWKKRKENCKKEKKIHGCPKRRGQQPCSLSLSATSQQYFSLRTNQPQETSQQYFSLRTNQHQTSQQYFSLRTNQHQPSATSQPNR
jgi:hypothetical protein